jgi:hypothetical protein
MLFQNFKAYVLTGNYERRSVHTHHLRVHGLEWSGRAGGCVDVASLSCVLLRPYG